MTLKPDTEVADLIAWISSITCEQFIIPGSIDVHGKKVTVVSPQLITRQEAYQLFLDALDSAGLTLVRTGRFWLVVETARARTFPIPFQVEPRGS
jgi:general secretion pathway protein D